MTYIPKIGDAVAARRKIKSKIYHNLLVGPIYDTSENSCVMVNERGTERETKWTLFYSDWDFEYLFPDEPVITTHNSEYLRQEIAENPELLRKMKREIWKVFEE